MKKKLTYLMLAVSFLLLLGSAVGSTRAALTYYSENYVAEITVSQIGVSLLEAQRTEAPPRAAHCLPIC